MTIASNITKPKGEHNPDPSDQWVKQTLIEDYAYIDQAEGREPNIGDIDRMVQEDLRKYHARQREDKRKRPEAKRREGPSPHQALADATGWRYKREDDNKLFRRDKPKGRIMTPRAQMLMARARFLMSLEPGGSLRKGGFRFPKFGKILATEFMDYQMHRGDYKRSRAIVRDRVLTTKLEALAERSTLELGMPRWDQGL